MPWKPQLTWVHDARCLEDEQRAYLSQDPDLTLFVWRQTDEKPHFHCDVPGPYGRFHGAFIPDNREPRIVSLARAKDLAERYLARWLVVHGKRILTESE